MGAALGGCGGADVRAAGRAGMECVLPLGTLFLPRPLVRAGQEGQGPPSSQRLLRPGEVAEQWATGLLAACRGCTEGVRVREREREKDG